MDLNVQGQYIADENERDDGAKYYLEKFGENSLKVFTVTVGPIKNKIHVNRIESYISFKLEVDKIERKEVGIFSKKDLLKIQLKPQTINYENMLRLSNLQYDLILAFNVSVNPECA